MNKLWSETRYGIENNKHWISLAGRATGKTTLMNEILYNRV
jgi:type IV secretory pathway ATPase VirB11/archaellum biosynthesis ATPase